MKELITRLIVIALSPTLPGGIRFVNLIPIFNILKYNIVRERLEKALRGEGPFSLAGSDNLNKCINNILTEEKFADLLNHACIARIYEKSDNEENFIGIIIFFRTKITSVLKPVLRSLGDYRSIIYTSPEED